MTDCPSPPIAAYVDLREFRFMPLDVQRLRDSDLSANASAEGFRAAVLLWCGAWHQVPAGSLPNDDKTLSQIAGYGRVVSEWLKVKDEAMHGWTLCSDGRLYHAVVVEKAIDGWNAKLERLWRTECSRIRKHNSRHSDSLLAPTLEEFRAARPAVHVPCDNEGLSRGTPQAVPEDRSGLSHGTKDDVPRDIGGVSHGTEGGCHGDGHAPVPCDIGSKGMEGNGISSGSKEPSESVARGSRKRMKPLPADNLHLLQTFEPTAEQIARLATKYPRIADRLTNLADQFRTDPWWCERFRAGKYSDSAQCFENFCSRQEGRAIDRGVQAKAPVAPASSDPYRIPRPGSGPSRDLLPPAGLAIAAEGTMQ